MRVSLAAIAAVFLAGPAMAQEWTGPYVGAHIGYGWGHVDVTDDIKDGVPPGPFSYDTKNVFGGGTAGYNIQMSALVLGVEGDLGYMNVDGGGIIPSSNPAYHQDTSLDSGLYADITGRAGVAFGSTLVYGKGGWAFLDSHAQQTTTKPGYMTNPTGNFDGWVYGGGVEHKITQNLSIKVEYLHFDFQTQGGSQTSTGDPPIGYVYHNWTNPDVDTVKIGINYEFGGPQYAGPLK